MAVDFPTLKLHVSKDTAPWPDVPFRRASVNSFGYGGSNAHVVLDESSGFIKDYRINHISSYLSDVDDDFFASEKKERPRVLLFSANDETSLKSFSKAIVRHFANLNVKVNLKNLAYTLAERRSHHVHRAYVIATRTEFADDSFKFGKIRPESPKIGFIFTGQGAQWSQMGRSLVETLPKARALLEHLDTVLQSLPEPPKWSLLGASIDKETDPDTQVGRRARGAKNVELPSFARILAAFGYCAPARNIDSIA